MTTVTTNDEAILAGARKTIDLLTQAIILATKAHAGQVDKAGGPSSFCAPGDMVAVKGKDWSPFQDSDLAKAMAAFA